jgi:hypothetical protein
MAQTRLAFLTIVLISDLAATILIGAATQPPMVVVVAMVLFRPVVLFVAFGSVLLLTTRSGPPSTARFVGACVLFYLWFPLCVWALKPGTDPVADVYFDLHAHADLFAVVCLPFLLASSIGVYLTAVRRSPTPASNA